MFHFLQTPIISFEVLGVYSELTCLNWDKGSARLIFKKWIFKKCLLKLIELAISFHDLGLL